MIDQAHIIGSGAIGSLLSANVQEKGTQVVRHVRSSTVECVTLYSGDKVRLVTKINDWQSISDNNALVVFPLKSYQIAAAIDEYLEFIPTACPIVLLHNGMGCYQSIAEKLSSHNVYLATTSHGAFKPTQYECVHTGLGLTNIGPATPNQHTKFDELVKNWFQQVLPPVSWHQNIEPALWQKLAVNALINPLTALHDIRNGQLASDQFRPQLEALAVELTAVANAENIDLSSQAVLATTFEVIKATANNFSSMHQDIHYRKPTEIDAITGYILQCADKHAKKCPNHRALYERVMALCRGV